MNIFNLSGQNKSDNEAYWEFDQTQHFQPQLNTGDFYKLDGFEFGWFVLEPISEYIKGRKGELKRGKAMSYGQKALYYWWYVDGQVTNGGFTQFYYNEYGTYVPTILRALDYIGDNKMAELVNRSYELYLKENKKVKDARQGGLEGFSNLYKEIKDFDDLDEAYYNLNDKTMEIIENYIRNNPNEFCLDENGDQFDSNFSGEHKTYHNNGIIKEVFKLENGTVSGTFKSYFDNGKPRDEIEYKNGKQTGIRTEFYENGNKKFSITYSENPIGRLHSNYYDNGNLKSTEIYITENDRDGKWIKYHPNGQIKSETEFIKGDFLVQNCWEEDGTQILKDGTGLYITENTYWEGFTQRNEQEYRNYKRDGKQYTYDNKKLSLYQEMKEGKEHGKRYAQPRFNIESYQLLTFVS